MLGVWTGLSINYTILYVDYKADCKTYHTFVLSTQSSIRDSVDATYHMQMYQVKNTQYYYYKIVN